MKRKKRKKKLILIPILILIILFSAYLTVAFYFNNHFYPGTKINNIDCGLKTVDEVTQLMEKNISGYILTIVAKDGTKEYIKAADFGLTYVPGNEVNEIKASQSSLAWPALFFTDRNYTMNTDSTYSPDTLKEKVSQLQVFQASNMTPPADAYIDFIDSKYVIVDEVEGNQLNLEAVQSLVQNAVDTNQTLLKLEDHDCYYQPAITADNEQLIKQMEVLNSMLDLTITYQFGEANEVLTGAAMSDWLSFDANSELVINRDSVYNYVYQLASKYNTFGKSRTITSAKGNSVTINGGHYGWVINKDSETDALLDIIKTGESVTREPVYEQTALYHGEDDVGDTYVEIDYSNQRLWFIKNGSVIVESDIVSGNMSKGYDSPAGTYGVMFKETDFTLVGQDYNSPVKYWVPFAPNVGMHDASWRSEFGGDIYMTSGSHGCVNLPLEAARQIYENIEVGTPVYCYY